MFHPSATFGWVRVRPLQSAAVAIHRTLSVLTAECRCTLWTRCTWTDTTADGATSSQPFGANAVTTGHPLGTSFQCSCDFFLILGHIQPMSCRELSREMNVLPFGCRRQRTDMQRLHCYALLLCKVLSYLSIRRINTPQSATFFDTQYVYRSEHSNSRDLVRVCRLSHFFARFVLLPHIVVVSCIAIFRQRNRYDHIFT
jgi:hypothetical protein